MGLFKKPAFTKNCVGFESLKMMFIEYILYAQITYLIFFYKT
jgi:hypothetical protein